MFGFAKHIFSLRFAFLLLIGAILVAVYQNEVKQLWSSALGKYLDSVPESTETVITQQQLAMCNGEDGNPICLALLGVVFDVSKGIKHYGTGCSYNFFVGRDASASFVTGDFENYDPETSDDVLTLKPSDLLELAKWQQFYEKEYTYKGKLIGRFYDEQGKSTSYHKKFLALVDQAETVKAQKDELRKKYPGCNIKWSEESGTRVWCTPTSGDGIERSWIGYPRKLFSRDNKNFHCACVPEKDLDDAMFKAYDNCAPNAFECFYRV